METYRKTIRPILTSGTSKQISSHWLVGSDPEEQTVVVGWGGDVALGSNTYIPGTLWWPCFDCNCKGPCFGGLNPKNRVKQVETYVFWLHKFGEWCAMDLPPHIRFQECKSKVQINCHVSPYLAGFRASQHPGWGRWTLISPRWTLISLHIFRFPRKDRYTLWMNPNIKQVMGVTFASRCLHVWISWNLLPDQSSDQSSHTARFQGRESSASLLWKAGLSGFDESASRMWSETPS